METVAFGVADGEIKLELFDGVVELFDGVVELFDGVEGVVELFSGGVELFDGAVEIFKEHELETSSTPHKVLGA